MEIAKAILLALVLASICALISILFPGSNAIRFLAVGAATGSLALIGLLLWERWHSIQNGRRLRHRPSWAPRRLEAPAGSVPKFAAPKAPLQLAMEPAVSGLWIRLRVTNHGPTDVRLRARITEIYGAAEGTLRVYRSVAWTVNKKEDRVLQPGTANAELIDVAETDGMGTYTVYPSPPKSEAGIFRFQTIGEAIAARLPLTKGSSDLYTNSLTVLVALIEQDYRNQLTAEIEVGFENDNDPATGNLRPRARVVKVMP
jgi:hypothetical protein